MQSVTSLPCTACLEHHHKKTKKKNVSGSAQGRRRDQKRNSFFWVAVWDRFVSSRPIRGQFFGQVSSAVIVCKCAVSVTKERVRGTFSIRAGPRAPTANGTKNNPAHQKINCLPGAFGGWRSEPGPFWCQNPFFDGELLMTSLPHLEKLHF